jgi:hypothetical protein
MILARRRYLRLVASTTALLVASRFARAQIYPSRPITMIVPFAPGGVTDMMARMIVEPMRALLGQPIIIENVGGAAGSIGIASSADVFAGNEIDRAQVRQFIRLLTRIAIASGGAVTLNTHPSLTGIASGTGLSGSTQWHNSVRARAVMSTVKSSNDGAPSDGSLRQIEFRKNNYGPICATHFVRWQNGLFVPVEGIHSMGTAERATKVDEIFVALLRKFIEQNQTVSPLPGRG